MTHVDAAVPGRQATPMPGQYTHGSVGQPPARRLFSWDRPSSALPTSTSAAKCSHTPPAGTGRKAKTCPRGHGTMGVSWIDCPGLADGGM